MKSGCLIWVLWLCVVVVVPSATCAQSRSDSIVLRGSVSKTVTLLLSPDATQARVQLQAFENDGVLTLVIVGSGCEKNLQVPILIRSNVSYKVTASIQSQNAVPMQLRVLGVEPSGKLVTADAVNGVAIEPQFNMRGDDTLATGENLSTIDTSIPFTIFSGPRISIGGGLNSSDNALKAILVLSVQARTEKENWRVNLQLQGSGSEKF